MSKSVFKELTNNTNSLSNIFEEETELNTATKLFMEKLNECIRYSFKKVRITDKPNEVVEDKEKCSETKLMMKA